MSRHRQVRGMDFGEDYEGYYDVYGHSVEDDYCVSPSTAAQFLYPRGDKSQQLAAFMAEEGGIKEEDEEEEDIKEPEEKSLSQVRSQLSETDQAKLLSCLEEMHNILGDSQPEHVLINAIISHQFNLDQALNTLLQSSSTSNVATALPQRQDRRQERDLNSDIISSEIVSVNEMATKPISAGAELHCQKSPCTRTISVDKTPSAHEGSKAGSDWLNPQTDEQQSVVIGKSCGCGGGAPKTLLFSYLSNGEEEAGSAPPLTRSVRIPPGFEKSYMRTKERLLAEPKSTGLLVASPSTTRVVADSESLASLTTLLDKQPVSLFELAVGADNGNRTEAPSLAAMAAAHGLAESDQASVCSLANLKETEMPFHSGSSAPQSIVASTQRRTRMQASRIAEHGEAMRQERLPASLAVLAALDKGAPSGARIVSLADLARHDLHLTGSSVLSDVAAAGAQRAEESVAALPQTSHAQSKCVADAAACHRDPSVTSHRPHTSVSTLPFTQHSTETTTTFVNIPRTVTTNSPLTQFLLSSLASSPDCKTTNPPPSQFSLSSLASSPDCTPANPLPSQFSLSSLASSPDCKTTNPLPSQFSLSSLASSPDCKTTNPPPSQFSLSSLASSPDCTPANPLPSQFSLSTLASSPDCKTTNPLPSQFSLSSLASSPDCKTTNPLPSQFSLSSLASSPDCKATNPLPSQFSLSSLASSPDCKTTNHPPSQLSLSSLASSPDCKTTNPPPSPFSLSSLASSPDFKTTNPPPSQFSLSSLASSPDCKTTNHPPSQFSLSSLASSPDCKPANPLPSQFSLSSLASSPDCKTTNPLPSQFLLSSLASSPDCKTTNHPPSQFSLSSLASSPDCKTTNSPSSQFSLLSLVSSIDCKTTNPPPSQFSLSSLASSPDCKPTNPPCAQFSLSSHPSVPHGVVLLPGHDATSLPQCGWASDNKSPASIDREDLCTSAPRPSAHQEVNFDLSLTDGFPFRQPQSSTSGANVSGLSKKPSGFAHALCCRPSAPYRVNIFEPSDFLLRRDGLTSSEVRSQPNLYWVLRALYQAGTKEGADVLSLRSNSYGQESEKADLEANPSDSHPGMDAVPSGSHAGKDAEPSDGHPGRDAVPSRSHSGNDAGPSDSGSEVVESEADLDTASCDSSLDSAVTTYVNTTAPLGDSDTPESVAGREACSDIKASVTDSDSEQKQTRMVVPFDFGTPSPDDIVLSRQREAFREGYGQRSQRKMPVVQKAPSDRLLPKPVVVVPPGDATARITNSVAMINFSGQRTEGFEMPKKETRSGSGSGSGSRPMSRERTPDRTPEKSPEKTLEVPPRKTRTLEQATDASSPAPASTPSLPKSASKAKGLDKLDMEMEYEKRKATKKQMLNLVVIGHVDAGKSTLMGHVLYKLGQVNQRTMHKYEQESRKQGKSSFAFAWVLDETPEERQRGVTMDVAQTQFETDTKSVTLLDAPGHKDFIPNMITGAASADVAVLVVCATRGEFETGFESGGQTREHALLVRSLGVSQLGVAVNKMDTVGWSQERFDEITRKLMQFLKQAGFKEKDVSFVPCSGLSGENLVAAATDPLLCSWYGGPSMLQVIDRFAAPQRPVDKPFRLVVSDVYKGMGSGFCVSGRIEAGSVQTGEKVLVMPTGDMALVKAIQLQDDLVTCAFAGDHVIVTLFNIEMTSAAIGHVLCYAAQPIRVASVIQARIVVFNIDMPITRGFPVVFHYQMLNETAVIRKLISQLHKSNGEVIKKRPRCLTKQSNALIELAIERPICMELYKDNRDLGRFMLRYAGHTIAAGLVTEIIS